MSRGKVTISREVHLNLPAEALEEVLRDPRLPITCAPGAPPVRIAIPADGDAHRFLPIEGRWGPGEHGGYAFQGMIMGEPSPAFWAQRWVMAEPGQE